jgi:hypothetical protein
MQPSAVVVLNASVNIVHSMKMRAVRDGASAGVAQMAKPRWGNDSPDPLTLLKA